MSEVTRVCSPDPLQAFATSVFRAIGADEEIATEVADHLVRANLSGHDSHGVIRVPQYVEEADRGVLRPAARPTVVRETPATAIVDGNHGFGQFSTPFALQWALERARRHGLAAVVVRHSMHIGRLGEYTERAAVDGLIAIVTVGAAGPGVGRVAIHGGQGCFFATNPWSVAVPGEQRSMMFDGATSMIAEGKIRVARAKGSQLPPGCIVDKRGTPTQDPEDFYAGGALVPLGGDAAGHKGYGLALASALIGGLCMIDDPEPTWIGAPMRGKHAGDPGRIGGVFVLAIDPAAFGTPDRYRALVDETLAAAKRVPPAPGRAEVLLPGEPEVMSRQHREAAGIPLPERTWQDLAALGERFRIALPPHRRS